ncbi:Crp/Fnr family transcriptional regulator [uncultured Bacteroides sp.]|uniref:Crp/Fnr family transcriptional regulator n=1 Tax=uncultured Bacteroides sp. TaxID=162156 RepID=UPI002AABAA7B|nr:Crp/Fnr family transcriptional regulator [uncultured Bacteroides sp.]
METMYDTLLQLPLFQGLCHEDFTTILEKVKLHFTKHKAGEMIIKQGDICDKLIFLLKGELSSLSSPIDQSFVIIEHLNAPHLIEAYSLFGIKTHYASSYVARSEAQTISISKAFVLTELFKYEIFRLNYMNIISSRAQNLHNRIWQSTAKSLPQRIINFILIHSEKLTGEKELKIRMEDVALHVDDTRLNVSKALNDFQKMGLISLSRKAIHIPEISKLVEWLEKSTATI